MAEWRRGRDWGSGLAGRVTLILGPHEVNMLRGAPTHFWTGFPLNRIQTGRCGGHLDGPYGRCPKATGTEQPTFQLVGMLNEGCRKVKIPVSKGDEQAELGI